VVGAVLPAEFNRDPLGIGRATGIAALWAPDEVRIDPAAGQLPPASVQRGAIRTLEIEIPLGAGGDPAGKDQLEYKVRLPRGGAMLYSWQAEGAKAADEFYAEFHGHTLAEGDKMTVAEYRKESETANSGALTAAFDGIHGWYFLNTSERAGEGAPEGNRLLRTGPAGRARKRGRPHRTARQFLEVEAGGPAVDSRC
jgi:hypothetical protein